VARIEDLVARIPDHELRAQIEAEVATLKDETKFGLVYERHLPETVLIGNLPLKVGDHVRPRQKADTDQEFRVTNVAGDTVTAERVSGAGKPETFPRNELLLIKPFGEPVYPSLTPVGSVPRGGDKPFHAVINGENFHTLQLLLYLYEGKVDCIYIDPPYNSGAADWKYNNRYVDSTDRWRHSKWLSFMEKRICLARRLLRPDGVLIVTVDENEAAHLGVLLEDLMPEYLRYMVTIVINPKGTAKANFSRLEEYAYFCCPNIGRDVIAQLPAPGTGGNGAIEAEEGVPAPDAVSEDDEEPFEEGGEPDDEIADEPGAEEGVAEEAEQHYSVLYLRRRGAQSSARSDRPRQFYAIYVNEATRTVVGIGPELDEEDSYEIRRDGEIVTIYPIDSEGNERVWRYGRDTMQRLIDLGEIRVGRYNGAQDTYTLNHWKPVAADRVGLRRIRTVWWQTSHDAGTHGSTLLYRLLGKRNVFPFPKSLYAVRDALEAVIKERPDALVLDFFAGSGTTLHATCLLNAEDGGRRRCILVTNNEVDKKTTNKLRRQGHFRGDPEFEAHGIFEAATRPRVEAAVKGKRPGGGPMPTGKKYQYLDGRQFADGFEENVEFYRLDYLDPDQIELGQRFDALHPALWLSAGGAGRRPKKLSKKDGFAFVEGARYAVLFEEDALGEFEQALTDRSHIERLFLVTDSEEAYAEMRASLDGHRETTMLYADYLRSFRELTKSLLSS
jgi:adenine-specific DNA-methyltransferase